MIDFGILRAMPCSLFNGALNKYILCYIGQRKVAVPNLISE